MRLFLGLFCNISWGLNNCWWHGHWAGQTLQRMWNSWSTTFSLERFVFFSPWIYQDADCRVARDKKHYLAQKVLKLTVSRSSHQDINGTEPESWPKKLKTIQVSLSLPLEILTILSARLHSPGIQRTSLSQIFQLSVVTIQYCRQL